MNDPINLLFTLIIEFQSNLEFWFVSILKNFRSLFQCLILTHPNIQFIFNLFFWSKYVCSYMVADFTVQKWILRYLKVTSHVDLTITSETYFTLSLQWLDRMWKTRRSLVIFYILGVKSYLLVCKKPANSVTILYGSRVLITIQYCGWAMLDKFTYARHWSSSTLTPKALFNTYAI